MGGIIVVDFIDMHAAADRKKLYEHLKEEMSHSRTKHKILPLSRFGLMQITRQRVREEVIIETKEKNPNSNGKVEAPISLIDIRPIGAFGRLYLGGTESAVQEAAKAAISALESIKGKPNIKK